MKITVQGIPDLRRLAKSVRGLDGHIQLATAVALNRVAAKVRVAVRTRMAAEFDRPMPIVLNALRVQPATKRSLEAHIFLKNAPLGKRATGLADVLQHQFFGGNRKGKGSEAKLRSAKVLPRGRFIVPARGAARDAYGNLPRAQITRALTEVRVASSGKKPMADRRRRSLSRQGLLVSRGFGGKRRTLDQQYFIARGRDKPPLGIWRLMGKGRVEPFMVFATKPRYRQRINIDAIGRKIVKDQFGHEFGRAFAQALKTAGFKGSWR